MNKLPAIFVVLVFMLSCIQNNTGNLPHELKQLEGSWQLNDSNTFEIWENKGTLFMGRVIKVENQDTLLMENLRIFPIGNDVFYEATVPNQNEGKSIRFKLTESNSTYFQFENPEHDFPQKITYNFYKKNKLNATISGNKKQVKFNYQKIK